MAARSFSITVVNYTGRVFNRTSLNHGVWSNEEACVPPEQRPKVSLNDDGDVIPGVIFFESESQGFMTGTEGSVDYVNDAIGTVSIYWDNPFIGSNEFSVNVPDGYSADYGDIHRKVCSHADIGARLSGRTIHIKEPCVRRPSQAALLSMSCAPFSDRGLIERVPLLARYQTAGRTRAPLSWNTLPRLRRAGCPRGGQCWGCQWRSQH
jgi:hypothetical protein